MSILFPSLLLLSGIVLLCALRLDTRIRLVLFGALGLRLLFSMLNVVGISFPFSDTTDVGVFLAHAEDMSPDEIDLDVSQSYVWASVIGIINLYTGDMLFTPLIINSFAGVFTVLLGYRIAWLLLRNEPEAFYIALMLALMPPLVFISATYLREATVTLFFTMFVFYLLRFGLDRVPTLSSLFMLAASSVAAAVLHGAFLFLPVFAVCYALLKLLVSRLTFRTLTMYTMVLAAAFCVGALFFVLEIGASKVGALYTASENAIYSQILQVAASGMMREHTNVLMSSPLIYVWLAIGKFAFSPFFSGELRAFDLVRMPISIVLFLSLINLARRAFPRALEGVRVSFFVLLILLLSYYFLFSIGSADPDTAFRHHIKLLPVVLAAGFPVSLLQRGPRGRFRTQGGHSVRASVVQPSRSVQQQDPLS